MNRERPKMYVANIKDYDLLRAQYNEAHDNYTKMLAEATTPKLKDRIRDNLVEIAQDLSKMKSIRKEFEQGIRPEQEELKSIKYGKNDLQAAQPRTPNESSVAEYVANPEGKSTSLYNRVVENAGAEKYRISRSKAPIDLEEYNYLEKASSKDSQIQVQARDYHPEIRYDENGKRISQIRFADTRVLEDQKQFIDESHEGIEIDPTTGVKTYSEHIPGTRNNPDGMKVSKFYTSDQKQNYYQLLQANLGEDHPALTSLNNRAKAELSNIEVIDDSAQGINKAITQTLEKYAHVPIVKRGLEELKEVTAATDKQVDPPTTPKRTNAELFSSYIKITEEQHLSDEEFKKGIKDYIQDNKISNEIVMDVLKDKKGPILTEIAQEAFNESVAKKREALITPKSSIDRQEERLTENEQKLFNKISAAIVKYQDGTKYIGPKTIKDQITSLGVTDKGAIKVLNKLSVKHSEILAKDHNKITKESLATERKRLHEYIKKKSKILLKPVTISSNDSSIKDSNFKPDSSPPTTNKSNKVRGM